MYDKPRFLPAGDQALVVELGDAIDPGLNRRVSNLMRAVEKTDVPGILDLVPTYRSLLVYYDPMETSAAELEAILAKTESSADETSLEKPRIVHLPTLYGGEYGPDLEFVSQHSGLSVDEVVEVHSGTDYLIYMMGFSPGFPYLGGLPETLHSPRLESPRVEIPAGSVGIAESQTGVYSVSSPGGWRLIGRTPIRLFDPEAEPPSLLAAGDYVRFVPLGSEEEYRTVETDVGRGEYSPVTEAAT
jgi:KipI family sensor histidine kinase inhibitor